RDFGPSGGRSFPGSGVVVGCWGTSGMLDGVRGRGPEGGLGTDGNFGPDGGGGNPHSGNGSEGGKEGGVPIGKGARGSGFRTSEYRVVVGRYVPSSAQASSRACTISWQLGKRRDGSTDVARAMTARSASGRAARSSLPST